MELLVREEHVLTVDDAKKCLKGSLRFKAEELYRAVQGFFEEHHRWLLKGMLAHIDHLEQFIKSIQQRLRDLLELYEGLIDRLTQIPGINFVVAYAILSEVVPTLSAFAAAACLCSWAGVCPGNNESVVKRRSGRSPVRKGNLRTILIEAAWGAVRTKRSYYRAEFFSLRSRLGPKKAIMAIAHRLLKALYHVIKHGAEFKDLGENYLHDLRRQSKIDYLVRQARKLGYTLMPCSAEAE